MSDTLGLHMNTAPADPSVPRPSRLLDQLRDRFRLKHYSLRTERAYAQWVKRYIYCHGKRHPAEWGKDEVEAFLTSLAVERNVAASAQTQVLPASCEPAPHQLLRNSRSRRNTSLGEG